MLRSQNIAASLFAPLFSLALLSIARPSQACEPAGYAFVSPWYDVQNIPTLDGAAVNICPTGARLCPSGGDLLRQNVLTGEVVVLSPTCSVAAGSPEHTGCYLDECVPAGRYRYGHAISYECDLSPGSCGAYYYGEVTIGRDTKVQCTRVKGTSSPVVYEGKVPWQNEQLKCAGYQSEDGGCAVARTEGNSDRPWAFLLIGIVAAMARRRRDTR